LIFRAIFGLNPAHDEQKGRGDTKKGAGKPAFSSRVSACIGGIKKMREKYE
jgi:hypothetical protein